jgi:uncharacterized membrane protein
LLHHRQEESVEPLDRVAASFREPDRSVNYFNAIGPVALGTAVTLAVAARDVTPTRRILDAAAAIGLVGVLAATVMVTVPANQELEAGPAADYPSDHAHGLVKTWTRAHAVRTTLGIGAFVCAVASNLSESTARS